MPLGRSKSDKGERRGTPADLLVVGLGNPGAQFEGTRHNVGATVISQLAERAGDKLSKSKMRALTAEVNLVGQRIALAFPVTYMNNSGESVRILVRRFGLESPKQLVIAHDELDLDVGRIKLKAGGGLAGHNGLRSITQHLGTTEYVRLRIGIGKPPPAVGGADYVLRRPAKSELTKLNEAITRAADIVELLAGEGIDAAMASANRRGSPQN